MFDIHGMTGTTDKCTVVKNDRLDRLQSFPFTAFLEMPNVSFKVTWPVCDCVTPELLIFDA